MTKSEFLAAGLAALVAMGPLVAAPSLAQTSAETPQDGASVSGATIATLAEVMRISETFEILAEEGQSQAKDLEDGFFPDRGGAAWVEQVAGIYDPAAMAERFDAAFAAALGDKPDAIAAAAAFYTAPLGQRILTLELDARRAMIDDDVTEAAEVQAERMQAERDPRLRLIRDMIEAGDLVEMNVAGALTANLAFTRGLAEMAPAGQGLPAEEMMAQVWGQEGEIRASTTTWLFAYMAMAYGPLSDDEMETYIAFWESSEGRALSAALFAGFDAVFTDLSRQMGLATGRMAQSNEI